MKELPPIENTLSTTGSLSDHLLWQLSLQTTTSSSARSARPSSATSTTTGISSPRSKRSPRWASGRWRTSSARSSTCRRSTHRRGRARSAGVPVAAAPPSRRRGHAGREDRHRAPAPAAEPPGPRDRAQARDVDRDLREHIEIIRNLDPKPGSRYNPTQSQHVIPDVYIVKVEDRHVAALNEEGCRSCASARSTAGCSTRAAANRATRRAPTSRTSSARRCG